MTTIRPCLAPDRTEPDRDKPDKLPDQCCLVAKAAGRMTGLMSRAAGA